MTILAVAAGGALGSVARYLMVSGVAARLGAVPYGTAAVNVLGSLLMGLIFVVLVERGDGRLSPALMTGFLGGFTTFSAFSLDAVRLFEEGAFGAAAGYVVGSVVLSIAGLVAGLALARMLF